jgi:hypothetical protein
MNGQPSAWHIVPQPERGREPIQVRLRGEPGQTQGE